MGLDSSVIAASALTSHFVGTLRYGSGPQTRGMTFMTLSLGQLLYTLVCQRSDPRKLHPERLFENRTLDAALIASSGLAITPYFVPGLRRLLGIAPLGAADAALSLGMAAVPVSFVLARRGIEIERRGRPPEPGEAEEPQEPEAA
jgi:Ca2+-transporting ATPase